ncbi:MAG: POTRA domain-containing protein, partial [Verrucomicrobiota bacterium]
MIGNSHPGRLVGLALILFAQVISAQVLPPPPAKLTMPATLFVREFQFTGNRAFTAADLAKITAPFTNRAITSEDLEDARRAITLHYINHGYVNSGAIIPDQDPAAGVITIHIVEGTLTKIKVAGNKWLRDDYITSRLQRWSAPPLKLDQLKEGLSILRQNPNVKQVNAELLPGATPGDSILDVRLVDQQPFRAALQVDNYRPPSVGAEQISSTLADLNLTGHSDPLEVTYGIANAGENDGWGFSGWDNVAGSYALPLNRYDTSLDIRASQDNTSIVENQFTALNINSESVNLGITLRQPIYQTANREVALSISFDRRQNNTTLLGQPYDISPGAENGRITVSVLGLSQEFIDRGQNHVLA